jgi:hypothetical protein
MWAMTNRHKGIAKALLDHGASPEVKSSSGRTAFDFVAPDSEISGYLQDSGYHIGSAGVTEDFYNPGLSQDRFEEEMAENELRRRMMMESARDLEVDLGAVGLDDEPEVGPFLYLNIPNILITSSHQENWTRKNTILIGVDVYTIRCSSSRRASSAEYWISLSLI